jgi:hypothetical protein
MHPAESTQEILTYVGIEQLGSYIPGRQQERYPRQNPSLDVPQVLVSPEEVV